MSGETKQAVSGWTIDTLAELQRVTREADLRFDAERDRRLTEVAAEREKALAIKGEGDDKAERIKQESDKEALRLAREIQTYKDEKANELREQIGSERGLYASKDDVIALGREIRAEFKGVANDNRDTNRWTIERILPIVIAIGIVAADILTRKP